MKKGKTSNAPGDDLFNKLPGELRNKIYDLVLLEEDIIAVRFGRWRPGTTKRHTHIRWKEPGVLRASKWIRNEAKAVYYRGNIFEVKTRTNQIQEACDWIHSAIQGCEGVDRYFNLGTLHVSKSNWEDIHLWISLAKVVRSAGVIWNEYADTDDPNYEGRFGGYLIGVEDGDGIDQAFYEVAMLGQTAAREHWDEVTLEIEFEEWVEKKMITYSKRCGGWGAERKEKISKRIGKLQRRMMDIEEGHPDRSGLGDGFRGRGTVEPLTMQLRSRDA